MWPSPPPCRKSSPAWTTSSLTWRSPWSSSSGRSRCPSPAWTVSAGSGRAGEGATHSAPGPPPLVPGRLLPPPGSSSPSVLGLLFPPILGQPSRRYFDKGAPVPGGFSNAGFRKAGRRQAVRITLERRRVSWVGNPAPEILPPLAHTPQLQRRTKIARFPTSSSTLSAVFLLSSKLGRWRSLAAGRTHLPVSVGDPLQRLFPSAVPGLSPVTTLRRLRSIFLLGLALLGTHPSVFFWTPPLGLSSTQAAT